MSFMRYNAVFLLGITTFSGAIAFGDSAHAAAPRSLNAEVRVIVKLKSVKNSNSGAQKIQSESVLSKRYGSRVSDSLRILETTTASEAAEALFALSSDPTVEYAELDQVISVEMGRKKKRPTTPPPTPAPPPSGSAVTLPAVPNTLNFPSDTKLSEQWSVIPSKFSGSSYGINVYPLWQRAVTGSSNIVVAIVDTGIDHSHPDLSARIFHNAGEAGALAKNGIDDDHNGFVDDYTGWRFDSDAGDGNDASDDHTHGTHVSGIISAQSNNSAGMAGISWGSRLLPVRALDASGSGYLSDAVRGIQYATAMGAKIINISWGAGSSSQALKDAIGSARAKGILVVAAAGNDGVDTDVEGHYPSALDLDNIISVAATNRTGYLESFSNFGVKTVDITAPGRTILSTLPGGGYGTMSGTSMATPMISGVAALIWSGNPNLTIAQVRDRIFKCSTILPRTTDRSRIASGGIVNAWNAYHQQNCR